MMRTSIQSFLATSIPVRDWLFCRHVKNLPPLLDRNKKLELCNHIMGGDKMPYGITGKELIQMLTSMNMTPTEAAKEFAEKYGIPVKKLMGYIEHRTFLSVTYSVSTVEDILELEFTKMLENDVRFRKCKRCGKYFIMKGNYDANYCTRIAEGETRTCQELAAVENYRARIADNKAIPIYNKYYKRYAARVRVRQIKGEDFKEWKYKALEKRDQCSDGIITPEEYTE